FVVFLSWLRSTPPEGLSWALLLWDAALAGPEAWLAWWVYHRLGRGARRLSDPRSAILFLLLVPGGVTGLFALLRAAWLVLPHLGGLGQAMWPFWASRALS